MPILMTDPTAKTHVRKVALVLFAEGGIAATSLRAIATAAEVSPGLIVHHFGSKDGLRRAVDADVLKQFDAALDETEPQPPDWHPVALVRVLRTRPTLVQYLGRALSEDLEVGRELFDRVFPDVRAPAGGEVDLARSDEFWSSIQELVLIIGPLFLLRFLNRELGASPLHGEHLTRWMEANARRPM